MHENQQILLKMPSIKQHNSKISRGRMFWIYFEPFKQVFSVHQAILLLIFIFLTLCASNKGPIMNAVATGMATTNTQGTIKEQIIGHNRDNKGNSIASGTDDHQTIDRSTEETNKNKQLNNWQTRSSPKSYPGMINGDALFRQMAAKEKQEQETKAEKKEDARENSIDIEQITGRHNQEGVIDFGQTAGQYATFMVQQQFNGEQAVAAADTLALGQQQTNNKLLALEEVGLEHRNDRKKSNINHKNNIDDNNQDHNDHSNHKQAFSTRRKRFQDSDRLQMSDFGVENSENSNLAGLSPSDNVAESGSSNSKINSNGSMMTTTTLVSTITSKSPLLEIEDPSKLKCRVERDLYLDFETYKHYSCANCYNGIPDFLFINKFFYDRKKDRIRLTDLIKKRKLLPNETETIRSTFRAENTFKNWEECCLKALECCVENQKYLPKTYNQLGELIDDNGGSRDKCHATWDGLSCWPDSPAGATAYRDCPDHAYVLEFTPICRGKVSKQCFSNGSWFMRTDHEWSDYDGCSGKAVYRTRLLIASVWHLVSVIFIGPALVVLKKVPNRGGSKRVRILSNLLFWLLLNGLLAATYKIGIIEEYFQRTEDLPTPPPPVGMPSIDNNINNNNNTTLITSSGPPLALVSRQMLTYDENDVAKIRRERSTRHALSYNSSHSDDRTKLNEAELPEQEERNVEFFDLWRQRLQRPRYRLGSGQKFGKNICDSNEEYDNNGDNDSQLADTLKSDNKNSKEFSPRKIKGVTTQYNNSFNDILLKKLNKKTDNHQVSKASDLNSQKNRKHPTVGENNSDSYNNNKGIASSSLINEFNPLKITSSSLSVSSKTNTKARCKRDTKHKKKQEQSTFLVCICWIFTVGIRITRLLGYAWMFTGAVYLCSVLHFAPAEPPALYIKWLMYLTNGFPVMIGLTYIIVRTIHEPSPLNILVKVPYYHLMNDTRQVSYLLASQLTCWTGQSKYDYIEDIADSPNYVLVILNGVLFVVTLIIMCRITRPGSTRPEMSLGDYFKAAGTLVLLYGAHYALVAYRPPEEGCIIGQVMHYSFLFVDGIQGIAVSYVFCYRTSEGREIIHKWCKSLYESNRLHRCGFSRKKHIQIITSSKHGLLKASNKSNQSTRSTNSACNGNDPATELININSNNNSRTASQF